MKYIAGFIGIGNMGGALLNAVSSSTDDKVCAYDLNQKLLQEKSETTGCFSESLKDLCENSKYIFLGVKPNVITSVLGQIKDFISDETVLVSMAAGISIDTIVQNVNTKRVIRIMPNTPVTVGEGVVLYCTGEDVFESDISDFLKLMKNVGTIDSIDEKLIDAAAALSGCGPAFVYMFIDALADGAVKCGLSREKAILYAKQTVCGSAAFSLESDKHLEKLKDEVCSPGGTTIEGVLALEKASFRHAVSSAVIAAFEKTKLL